MIASIVHPYCQKVLPLVYDDSLSYYEVLCKLRLKINECIEIINSYEDDINELKALSGDILGLKDSVSKLEDSLAILDEYSHYNINLLLANNEVLSKDLQALTDRVNAIVTEYDKLKDYIDSRYDSLVNKINSTIYDVTKDLYIQIAKLQSEIDELYKTISELDTKAYNPWARRLQKESLQNNLNFAYSDLADKVPTAGQYSEVGLTANEYRDLGLTAHEYALRGCKHLHLDWVYSPVYGFRQNISNVLTSIVNYFDDTLSADEYSLKSMSAEDYSELNIDAQTYYHWRGTTGDRRVVYSPTGRGLTRAHYRHLNVNDRGEVNVSDTGNGITSEGYNRLTLDSDNGLIVGETTSGIDRAIYERLEVVET